MSRRPLYDGANQWLFTTSTKVGSGSTVWALDANDTAASSRILWQRDLGDTDAAATFDGMAHTGV